MIVAKDSGARAFARLAVLSGALLLVLGSSASAQCVGDCNGDGNVAINELILGVNISLGSQDVSACTAMDGNSDGTVSISELITAVNISLAGGCDAPPTPTMVPTPEPVTAKCTLDPDESTLTLATALFAIPIDGVNAEIDIECEEPQGATSGLTGDLSCSCAVDNFDALSIPGIGDVCVAPFSPCESRTLTCDGGASIDADVVADHNIGECTGAADCVSQCEDYCGELGAGYQRQLSTCEDFCIGGENDGQTCMLDTDCPDGSCGGPDGGADGHICECVCAEAGRGDPAPAGGFSCALGVAITVELDESGVCGDVPPTITLDPVCGELTSETSVGVLLNATNATGVTIGPSTLTGVGTSCTDLASGSVSGLNMIGHLAFFGSAVGDILVDNNFVCQ